MGEYRRENTKHLFPKLMGEGACQVDIFKLFNANTDACTPSQMCYRPSGDKLENVKLIAVHHGLSSVHVMHHNTILISVHPPGGGTDEMAEKTLCCQ